MDDHSTGLMVVVVVVAFIAGFSIVSFILKKFQRATGNSAHDKPGSEYEDHMNHSQGAVADQLDHLRRSQEQRYQEAKEQDRLRQGKKNP